MPGRRRLTVVTVLSAERAVLRLERSLVLNWLSRAALLLAVASNADKAAAVFAARSLPGSWSPWALAAGLELALAVSSYALAGRMQHNAVRAVGQPPLPVAALWLSTGAFAGISTIANVVYFAEHGGDGWGGLALAVAFGLAAPLVAIANAVLTGDVAGVDQAHVEVEADRQHELERLALSAEIARHQASLARADARRAKTERAMDVHSVSDGQPVDVRVPTPPVRDIALDPSTQPGQRRRALLAVLAQPPDGVDLSVRSLAAHLHAGRTTVHEDLRLLEQLGLIRRTADGHYEVIVRM